MSMLSDAAARAGSSPALVERARVTECESFRVPIAEVTHALRQLDILPNDRVPAADTT